ncbi:F-box/kelch-repeat protein At3g61590-like [Zingiber officinale]|uniref:F-box/kelch-repeat protein At3g61590-like n=1 Tax=Zingiber officinale TaxID=94328 RepID=UPI001C4DBA59|nr:F-box/kelch-repeat protein At3g61590-like [Zingiber officinale]
MDGEDTDIRTMRRDSDGEEDEEEEDNGTLLSWDAILPDELLQKVLSLLPIADIIKLGIVCKRWYEIVHSRPSLWTMMAPQKPWFLLSCFNDCVLSVRAYDPCLQQWHIFGFPGLEKSIWHASSSYGLVCLTNHEDRSRLLVSNPITRDWKRLPHVPGGSSPDYNALALSFDRRTRSYTVVFAKCTAHMPGNNHQWHFSIDIYKSTTQSWATLFAQDLGSWKGGDEGVVCDGVFYYLIHPNTEQRPHLVAFDLAKPPSTIQSLIREAVPAPCPLTCARLINLSDKLVMVGGGGWCNRLIKGLTIWELEDKRWREVTRMPVEMSTSLCTIRENFICCGAGDLVFIQCLGLPMALLTFNMRLKVWRTMNDPIQYFMARFLIRFFSGFCFEPRLDVTP